ncbi:MAG: hypothetical protein LBR89_03425 [Holosporales bacterium]|nr:hypothetical protein [Holosporales bacterium]
MLHVVYFSIILSVFCVQSCGASGFGVPPMPDVNSGNAQRPSRQKFSQDEDDQLRELVDMYGTNGPDCWTQIASGMTDRTPRQCKERWNSYLAPQCQGVLWPPQDDALLCKLVSLWGYKWDKIAAQFEGRSAENVKNRFRQISRRNDVVLPQHNSDVQSPTLIIHPQSPAADPNLKNGAGFGHFDGEYTELDSFFG